jgi:flagellar hook-associated protein 2
MATLSSPGVGSGLDVNGIVTQLVALERKPIEQLQAQTTTIQTKLSSFGLLQSYTSNLRDIADRLAKADFWTQTTATSSDTSAVTVTSTSTAASGSYAVSVTQLAQQQSLASKAYTDSSSVVGSGSLQITLGTWNAGLTTFTADATKTPVTVTIAPASNTLSAIKTAINDAKAGVTASIVTDTSGSKLVVRSDATGAASAVRITVTDDDGVATDALGLSALAFNPPVAAGQMSQSQAGLDAALTINGLAITSSSNKLDSAISGVTLTLAKVTASPVSVTVGLDTTAQRKAIADFAKAYSDINTYILAQTKYDAATKKAAALQGDRATLTLQSNLRSIFEDNSSASLVYARLSDVGVEMQTDGSLKINDTKLGAALANPSELAKVFSSTTSADTAEQGFAVRVKTLAAQLIASDGAITTRTKGLRDSVTRNQTEQQRLEDRVALVKQRLLKQYGALDATLSQINGVGTSLTQSLAALASLSSSLNNNKK